jgi:hypothetical protein
VDTGGNGIKRNDREPGQQAFDKGFASAALRRIGGAMNPMEQLRCGDRRNRKIVVGLLRQLGL